MLIHTRSWLTLLALGAFGCDNSDIVANRLGSSGASGNGGETSGAASTGGASGSTNDAGSAGSSSGGSNSGGNAGTAGNAGAGGGEHPSPNCDDGNPCTADSFDDEACRHAPLADGQRCEDGDFCTLGDRCASGVCSAGSRNTGAAHVLGSLEAYGSGSSSVGAQAYSGSVVTPGDDRFVFLDQPSVTARLTETRVVDGSLQILDTLVVSSDSPPIATAWDDWVAVSGKDGNFDPLVQIVSVSAAGKLAARGTVLLAPDPFQTHVTAMVGRGHRLFVCTSLSFLTGALHWLDVTDPDEPVEIASGPLGSTCGSLAVSEDSERVYVNTPNGVRSTDLATWSGSGALTFDTDPVVPTDAAVALRGDELLARTGDQIQLLSETTHEELSSFSVPGAHAAAFTDAGILVEGDRALGGGSQYFVALYTRSGQLLQERIVGNYALPYDITSARPAVGGKYFVDTQDQQVFEITNDRFQPIEERSVGSLAHLYAGQGEVFASSHSSELRIDVTDPTQPVFLAGGPHLNPLFGIKLDESQSPATLLAAGDPNVFTGPTSGMVDTGSGAAQADAINIQRITVDSVGHHVPVGSIQLPGGPAYLFSAGDFLYRSTGTLYHNAQNVAGVHFQRWLESDLRVGIAEPALDLTFDRSRAFDVDPNARMAVVLVGSSVSWLDLSTAPPTMTVAPSTTPEVFPAFGDATRIKVRGHRSVRSDGLSLVFSELGSNDEQIVPSWRFPGAYIDDILAFDGNFAYLSCDLNGGSLSLLIVKRGVPEDQALVAEIPMPAEPTSLIAMDNSLVVSSATQLLTLSPQCE